MGFVKSIIGGSGGSQGGAGLNYNAQGASLQNPVTQQQIDDSYKSTQDALAQQKAFTAAMNPGALGGLSAQQQLSGMLMNQAQGGGPNPAQAQYQQNINQLAAQQAGAIAGQKGINPALAARMASQQGGMAKQNAAGQSAVLQAQQQLAAQGALGNLSAQQVGQNQQGLGIYNQAAQSGQQNLLNAQQGFNNQAVSNQANVNNNNAAISGVAAQGQMGFMNQVGKSMPVIGGMFGYEGGMVPSYADGGEVGYTTNFLFGGAPMPDTSQNAPDIGQAPNTMGNQAAVAGMFKSKGATAAPVKQGATMAGDPGVVSDLAPMAMMAAQGAMVPGKAAVKGNSIKNDVVPAVLSPGEIVIPRDVVNSKDPAGNAAKFVAAIMAKKRGLK